MTGVVCADLDRAAQEWLSQQKVCVTGGQGTLGRRLVRRLIASGVQHLVTLDKGISDLDEQSTNSLSVERIRGDILQLADLDRALRGSTVVFHLAALVYINRSQMEPVRYFEVNGLGTALVLEACRRQDVKRVIYTSTGHVYGTPRQLPILEDHPTVPISVYAASKLVGEVILQGYAADYGISCVIARLSNLYGASFGTETVVSSALKQAVSSGTIALRNLSPVRDFVHVDDAVEALVRLAAVGDGLTGCRAVNVSTGKGVSVQEMIRILTNIIVEQGLQAPKIIQTGTSLDEPIPELILDNSRLRELTGWSPQIDLERGLRLALQALRSGNEDKQTQDCSFYR